MRQGRWMCQRSNIGSRMNREIHVRFWERAEVKFLRATRHFRRLVALVEESGLRPIADVSLRCVALRRARW